VTGSDNYVALGTDMDGGLGRNEIPVEIETSADLPRVAEALSAAGFDDEAVRGVMGQNWLAGFQRTLMAVRANPASCPRTVHCSSGAPFAGSCLPTRGGGALN